jgi:CubicO group peptidase (beta-lactamase class C family)
MANTGEDDPLAVNPGRAYGHVTRNGIIAHTENDKLAGVAAPREFYATAGDLDLWCQGLLDGRVLSPKAERLSFTSHGAVDFDPGLGYGYGWFLGKNFRLIGGGTPGFRSELWQYPKQRLNVIMLWNNETINSHHLFWKLRPLLGL